MGFLQVIILSMISSVTTFIVIRILERADRQRWHKIANNLVNGAEQQIDEFRKPGQKNTNEVWLRAWHDYDQYDQKVRRGF